MSHCQELKTLLNETVLPEVKHIIDQMQEYAAKNEITQDMKEEQDNIHAVYDNFNNIADAIETGEIEAGNCEELLKELNMMRQMGMEAEA